MKKFAISIKGGSAKGFGAIGILRFFQEEGLDADIIAGSSAGAIVAVMYALGYKWYDMLDYVKIFTILDLINPFEFLREKSFVSRGKLETYFKKFISPGLRLEDLPIKTVLFASNARTRERVLIEKGNLIDTVVASCAYPIFFPSPIRINNQIVVDGDLTGSFSTKKLKEIGAEEVIGISSGSKRKAVSIRSSFIDSMATIYMFLKGQAEVNDVLVDGGPALDIRYDSSGLSYTDFQKVERYSEMAYLLTKQKKSQILEILS